MKKLRNEGRNEEMKGMGNSDVSMVELRMKCRRRSNSIRGGFIEVHKAWLIYLIIQPLLIVTLP